MSAIDDLVSPWAPRRDLLRPAEFPFTPHEGQEEYCIADYPVVLNIASNRYGKEMPVDTPVLTPSGWREMGELCVGDLVIAGDGTPTPVVGVYPQGVKPVYRLTFNDGASTRCGLDHLWKAKDPQARFVKANPNATGKQSFGRRYMQWGVYSLRDILSSPGGMRPKPPQRFSIPAVGAVRLPACDVPVDPYLMGVLLGDGGISKDAVRLSSVDDELLEEVRRLLPDGVSLQKVKGTNCDWSIPAPYARNAKGDFVRSNPLTASLRGLGLMGKRSWEKHVPDCYLYNDAPQRLALLQGLMDTDGSALKNGQIEFSSTSKCLADAVVFLAQSLGGTAVMGVRRTSYTYKGEKRLGRESYRVNIRVHDVPLFRLSRKLARQRNPCVTKERILVRIDPAGETEQVCIEVAHPERTYVVENCIVTHNTTIAHIDNIWRAHGVHPYKRVPLIETLWSGFPDFPFYEKVTRKIFLSLVPHRLLVHWSEQHKCATIRRVDGGVCRIWFVSYEQAATSWTGDAVGHIHLDEPVPEEHFNEAAARVATTGGQIYITVTPVNGLGWMEEGLYLPAGNKGGDNPDVYVIEGGLAEYDEALEKRDRASMGVGRIKVPHMDREKVLRFARRYKDPAERMVRVFGIYKRRTGGVYADFDPAVHVIPAFKVPQHYEVWGGCDSAYFFALVIKAMDETGRVYTVYEYFSGSGETAEQRVSAVWRDLTRGRTVESTDEEGKTRSRFYPPVLPWLNEDRDATLTIYIDTAALQDSIELNAAAAEIGARLVFTQLDQKLKAVDAGIRMLQNLLAPSTKREPPLTVERGSPSAVGEPRWYIFDNLYSEWVHLRPGADASDEGEFMAGSRLLWEMKNLRWKKPKPYEAHTPGPDKNTAGGMHMLDGERYATLARVAPPELVTQERRGETARERRVREHRERLAERVEEGS